MDWAVSFVHALSLGFPSSRDETWEKLDHRVTNRPPESLISGVKSRKWMEDPLKRRTQM